MQLERYTAEKLIKYLKAHGYPESSIAVEYQLDGRYMVDIAILDMNKNIPIQLFEIKSKKSPEMIKIGKEQLRKHFSFLKNKNIPTYLVFPKDEEPFFDYNFNTSCNRPNHTFRHLIPKASHRIPFSHYFTRTINPSNTQIK